MSSGTRYNEVAIVKTRTHEPKWAHQDPSIGFLESRSCVRWLVPVKHYSMVGIPADAARHMVGVSSV